MNDITRSDFGGNNGWTACEFVYSLLNGGEYRLRYWRRGDERLVYGKDLYESIGEPQQTFSRNFHYRKFDNEVKMQETNNRSYMCAFSDALLYILDRNAEYRETFGKRGTGAIIAGTDADVIGIVASVCGRTREEVAPTVKARAVESMTKAEHFKSLALILQQEGNIEGALGFGAAATLALENEKQAKQINTLTVDLEEAEADRDLYKKENDRIEEEGSPLLLKNLFQRYRVETGRSGKRYTDRGLKEALVEAGYLGKTIEPTVNQSGEAWFTVVNIRLKNGQIVKGVAVKPNAQERAFEALKRAARDRDARLDDDSTPLF